MKKEKIKKTIKAIKDASVQEQEVTDFLDMMMKNILENKLNLLVQEKFSVLCRVIENIKAQMHSINSKMDEMVKERKLLLKAIEKQKKIIQDFID